MAVVNDPVLSKKTIGLSDYTKITFEPDLSRFFVAAEPAESSGSGDKPTITSAHSAKDREFLIQNAMKLFERRAYDMAATLPSVKISFNNEVIPINNFAAYARMYAPKSPLSNSPAIKSNAANLSEAEALAVGTLPARDVAADEAPIMYIKVNARWEVAVMRSAGSFDSVSFVNNVWTSKGGTHVDLVTDQVNSATTCPTCSHS